MAKLDEIQKKQRRETLKQSTKEIAAVIGNKRGFERLKGISDKAFQIAEQEDADAETSDNQ